MPRPGAATNGHTSGSKFRTQDWNSSTVGGKQAFHGGNVDTWQGNQAAFSGFQADEPVSPGTVEPGSANYFSGRPPVPPPKDAGPSFAPRGLGTRHTPSSSASSSTRMNSAPRHHQSSSRSAAADIGPWEQRGGSQVAPWELPGDMPQIAPSGSSSQIAPWEEAGLASQIAPWESELSSATTWGGNVPRSIPAKSSIGSVEMPAPLRTGRSRTGTGDSMKEAFTASPARGQSSADRSLPKGMRGVKRAVTTDENHGRGPPATSVPPPSFFPQRPNPPQQSPFDTTPRASDVAPWEHQNFQDVAAYGSAPVRSSPTPDGGSAQSGKTQGHHRLHLPGHSQRQQKREENGKASSREREISPHSSVPRYLSEHSPAPTSFPMQPGHPAARSVSPLPSEHSQSPSEAGTHTKRKLFDKLRRHKGDKTDKNDDSTKGPFGSQKSLTDMRDPSTKRGRDMSLSTFDSGATIRPTATNSSEMSQRKESQAGKWPRRLIGRESNSREEDKPGNSLQISGSYFGLNLDYSNDISDIVHTEQLQAMQALPDGGALARVQTDDNWDAPDSWGVKRDDDLPHMSEIHEDIAVPVEEDNGIPHGLRVFRIDSTFATLSTGVNSTADEILKILGKKSFLQDHIETYQIIMKKQDLQRQLRPSEKPVAIQKRLLEQAGYEKYDRIEEVGREDNSYLCKFTFVPMKLSSHYSLEKDSGLSRLSKFRDIDLSGRSLVAIPIILYSRAAEIVSLNLSRNLALDVPKDFIQGCTHLRTILFTGNEAAQLPPSFSLALKLNYLDVSHNRLTQLDHANLENLIALSSLRASNNKLTALPPAFGSLYSLKKLNISSNSFKVFPELLCDLEMLCDLDISFNHIEKLPKIGQLRSLDRFVATNNRISGKLPDEFAQLVKLKELDIRHNGITSMDVFSQLPNLEQLFIGNNSISKFEGSFQSLKVLTAERNPITRFIIDQPTPSLALLDLSDAKIVSFDDNLFERIPNLTKLVLDKNQFRSLPNQIGFLRRLNFLSVSKNALGSLPPNIGCLTDLEILDAHECNLRTLPAEIWCCSNLKSLNLASNCLEDFPKLTPSLQAPIMSSPSMQSLASSANSLHAPGSPSFDEPGRTSEDLTGRRPSQASAGLLSIGGSPATTARKGSVASIHAVPGRKPSLVSRTNTSDGMAPVTRKDSNVQTRLGSTFASSLKHLSLSENRLGDEIFEVIHLLAQLRTLNLSYNDIDDIPQNAIRKWPNLQELYLSGNDLRSFPTEDLLQMENIPLRVLHLNSNKLQMLPAEFGKMTKLIVLDVGSNSLKYNVNNYKYDWNWNSNPNLKYLNFSGNKRLEIKPNTNSVVPGTYHEIQDLTNFNRMHSMRVLGLMDVTLMVPSVPDQTADRRVRSSDTQVGSMTYGMADTLGRNEHLSVIDLLIGSFRGQDTETLAAMFDGQSMSTGGSKVAKFLAENFSSYLSEEFSRLRSNENTGDALRRTFLALNKELASTAANALDEKEKPTTQPNHRPSATAQSLTADDVRSGGVATAVFLENMELYVANVGDAQALLMQSNGNYKVLTEKHHPAQKQERERIRDAGGFVSRFGKLNDVLEVSRAFGYVHLMPAVMARPSISHHTLTEQDELIVIASRELWEYVSMDVATDFARSERQNTTRAAEKLRDLAIAFGATNKIMVMVLGVADLKRRERFRTRGETFSVIPSGWSDDQAILSRPRRRDRHGVDDSKLGRLDNEVAPPQGELSLVFTDIKSSTALWEYNSVAMQAGIKIHNDLLRRQLRIIGGYEVKTEGDAFMVAFPTATSALLWCFTVQNLLLEQSWPTEIVESPYGREVLDAEGNVIYRGLSVRMGAHWGSPVCEPDPITRRMDYFGPMVNRASRISSVADGGQLTVSTGFITEIKRSLVTYQELDRNGSVDSEDTLTDDALVQSIRRDLRVITSQGFEVKDLGERKLKGLENAEFIYMMYPHSLAARVTQQTAPAEMEAAPVVPEPAGMSADSTLSMDPQIVWDLWAISLRLETIVASLELRGTKQLCPPETMIMERTKQRGGEFTDAFIMQFLDHLIKRVDACVLSLELRNIVRPFDSSKSLLAQAAPMAEIMAELRSQMAEFQQMKAHFG